VDNTNKTKRRTKRRKKGESEAERKAVPSIGERGRKKLLNFAPHWHGANQTAGE
jgi:hypothetical protein